MRDARLIGLSLLAGLAAAGAILAVVLSTDARLTFPTYAAYLGEDHDLPAAAGLHYQRVSDLQSLDELMTKREVVGVILDAVTVRDLPATSLADWGRGATVIGAFDVWPNDLQNAFLGGADRPGGGSLSVRSDGSDSARASSDGPVFSVLSHRHTVRGSSLNSTSVVDGDDEVARLLLQRADFVRVSASLEPPGLTPSIPRAAGGATLEGRFVETGPPILARQQAASVLLPDGRVLITGGFVLFGSGSLQTGGLDTAAEIYEPDSGAFTRLPSLLDERSAESALVLHDGRVLIVGGYDFTSSGPGSALRQRPFLLYDPSTDAVTRASSTTTRPIGDAVVLADGSVLVTSQLSRSTSGEQRWKAEVYDAGSDTLTLVGSPGRTGNTHRLFALDDGRALLVGSSGIDVYDPATRSFRALRGSRAIGLFFSFEATTMADGRVLVAGGLDEQEWRRWQEATRRTADTAAADRNRLANLELLASRRALIVDPDRETVTEVGSMRSGRTWHRMTALPDGRVLVTGGAAGLFGAGGGRQPPPEIFDPVRNAFDAVSLPPGVSLPLLHVATLLGDGSVLIAGSDGSSPVAYRYLP